MKVQLICFEGCPNADAAREAIRRNLAAAGLPPDFEEFDTESPDTPEALREWGSPTVLVDGVDVGGEPAPPGRSCRLYDNPENRGVPSDAAMAAALGGGGASATPALERNVASPARAPGLPRVAMAGAVVAAIAASACCVVPAVLAIIGISGVGFAAALEPYRPALLAATAALLGLGFYLAYRKPRAAAGANVPVDACGCPAPRTRRAGRSMLWIAALAVAGFAAYPYLAAATAETEKRGDAVQTAASQTAMLHIDGMTCESCASQIVERLSEQPGVVKASVSFADKSARVVYDPERVRPQVLARAVTGIGGYTATAVSP
jgi:copper chaperone CopZ